MTGAEVIRLEEYQGLIQNRLVAVWLDATATGPWLPTEFMLTQYITRILVTGRTSSVSIAAAADPSWTQVWRSPGAKEWSCLLGLLQYMPGPMLLMVGPDVALTPKLTGALHSASRSATVCVMRSLSIGGGGIGGGGSGGWSGELQADHVFFPVTDGIRVPSTMIEWAERHRLDLKAVLPQLAAQGYALTIAGGVWYWYKPTDSAPLVTLSVAQIARQLQILGQVLERSGA